ncbi:inner membrane protein import complex subunit Tim54-domain-containing protein [Crucibulum laeve]|uniref:Mitochondrial import inner membrane translocase subunit TIM54 n=1 Tax=Crucibulum laeve TaxID=68775 RepID=A0A5C3MDG4_9AGAR|nr:inner membrane protein import complex subunit Tim54-domain-containing protein [Crucibulum laeve]
MTTPISEKPVPPPATTLPPKVSGIRTVLRYTGIPPSWLDKRPKLPSRNWLIFLSVTSSVVGMYIYDRRECKRIRQSYIEKVQDLSEERLDTLAWPRRVTVYGGKWPGDEDYDQSMKYFRKYVKPILVAAAVDYDMIAGKKHGDIANRVANDIRLRRRLDLGIDEDPPATQILPTYKAIPERRKLELEGGIVIIGRPTFKEFMAGLKRGWTEGLEKIDQDEVLAKQLEDDTVFDEPEEFDLDQGSSQASTGSKFPSGKPAFSPIQLQRSLPLRPPPGSNSIPEHLNAPPAVIPPLPPMLLVSFTNLIGLKQIPLMIWDFFNQRLKVQSGSDAGYRLVMKATRPIEVPSVTEEPVFGDTATSSEESSLGDLEFDKEAEGYYKNSLKSIPQDIEKAREKYYEALPAKIAIARALSRGTREPTKEEYKNPPPTEVELRAERMKKEKRWRSDLQGWETIKPEAKVAWDERFRDAMRIFVDPPHDGTQN